MSPRVKLWECQRCGHRWVKRDVLDPSPPARCAFCKALHWQHAPTVPQRRPKKYGPPGST